MIQNNSKVMKLTLTVVHWSLQLTYCETPIKAVLLGTAPLQNPYFAIPGEFCTIVLFCTIKKLFLVFS